MRSRLQAAAVFGAVSLWLGGVAVIAMQAPAPARNAPPAESAPTFSKDVAQILYKSCVSCHRPGEIAPMSFINYSDVRPWAKSIREKVIAGTMPPWFADPHYGKFRNDRRLSQKEIDTIVSWANAGARQGDPAAMPKLPDLAEGWNIGKPDAVIDMGAEYQIPADGTVEYQYFEVTTTFTEDKWIQAGEVRVQDREHVHHATVYIDDGETRPTAMTVRAIMPDGQTAAPRMPQARPAGAPVQSPRRLGGVFVNYAVGEDSPIYPKGQAKRLKAGATLVFQMHYTTNGHPSRDRTTLGLVFAKQPPQNELRTGTIANAGFAIPAGDPAHTVEAEATFTDDVKVWTMHPHMHLRGKDMKFTATYPDGRSEILLNVPAFDFAWQSDFWLTDPISLPKGTKLLVTAHFDNSTGNANNPDPKQVVRWGDQTWEEMMIGYFTYTVDAKPSTSTGGEKR